MCLPALATTKNKSVDRALRHVGPILLLLLVLALPARADIVINLPGANTVTATQPSTVQPSNVLPNNAQLAKPQPYSVQKIPTNRAGVPQQQVPQAFPPQTMPNPNAPAFQRPCTKMWCREGVTINLPITNTPGQYRFVVTADGARYTCTGTLPLPRCGQPASSCDKPGILVGESGCALPPPMHSFNSLFLEVVPRTIEIDVTTPGHQPIHMAGAVAPQCFYPNGAQCDARPCCQAQVNVIQ